MHRRPSLAAPVLGLLLAATLAACGSENDSTEEQAAEPSTSEPSTSEPPAAEQGVFPAVVPHKFGETTVAEEPQRVVSVGVSEQDVLLQLGVTPVAVTEWYGEQPHATWPWATDLLGDVEPEVLSTADGFEYEKVAALEPDLIIGTNAGLTKKDYALFSKIAPTIPSVEGSTQYFSSWQDQTLQISRALGREADGQALVDEVTGAYAEVAAAHPEWAGRTATFSQGAPYDGELYVYPEGLSTDFLTDLGFTITPGLQEFAPDVGSQAEISAENVDLLEADVVVWGTETAEQLEELLGFGTVANLPAVAENRAVYTDDVLAGAIYFDTPLSLLYVLEHLTPMLEAAVTGEAPREFPS
ncbi:ABC transporter substrate-binding protein [Nocardioides sp. W7]|uniref:ABC transporter substrate-binding protein n=1 Tax=Nocardioides sp. W7 TaxID=2931390 RepID=UPI001FD59CD8|nr:ABC transporter substrate-binding protein [Nocardioides sp. W7]